MTLIEPGGNGRLVYKLQELIFCNQTTADYLEISL